MGHDRRRRHLPFTLLLAALALSSLGNTCGGAAPPSAVPLAGDAEYLRRGKIDVFGVTVQAAGGNGRVARSDWNVDTHLGRFAIAAHYNSATGQWQWQHEITYDGTTFVAPSGAVHSVEGLGAGDAIPGTHWRVLGPSTITTKGGLVYEFAPTGNLQQMRWRSGPVPRIEFVETEVAGAPRITSGFQCVQDTTCHPLFTVDLDPTTGQIDSISDAHGRTAFYDWDTSGRLRAARSPLDVVNGWSGWHYEYAGDDLVALTNSEGERTAISYDLQFPGRVTGVRRQSITEFRQYFFEYARVGTHNSTFVRDPSFLAERRVRFDWDHQYRILSYNDAQGESTTYEWGSASGLRVQRITNPAGTVIEFAYAEGSDDPTAVFPSTGNVFAIEYQTDAENRTRPNQTPIASIADSLGLVNTATYDELGRLDSETNGTGETATYSYWGDLNMVSSISRPDPELDVFLEYGYSPAGHGHPWSILHGSSPDPLLYAYDGIGNLLAGQDVSSPVAPGMPGIVGRSFDANRNLSSIQTLSVETELIWPPFPDPLTWTYSSETDTVQLAWRSDGRIASVSRPYGDDAEFEYDALGQFVERRERTDGGWVATRFEYSLQGQLLAEQLPNGMRREYAYQPNGQPSRRAFFRNGQLEGEVEWLRAQGQLTHSIDSKHTAAEQYAYDFAGRVSRIDYPNGEAVVYEYDIRSRIVRESFYFDTGLPMAEVTYAYDLADRRIETRIDGELLARDIYEDGSLVEEQYGNGLRRRYYLLDGVLPVTDLADENDNMLASVTFRDELCPHDPFSYAVECASAWTSSSLSGSGSEGREFYEFFTSQPQGMPGRGQRITHAQVGGLGGSHWYSYDPSGNMTQQVRPDPTAPGLETLDYEYNAEHNRLLAVRRQSDQEVAYAYTYDEAGFATSRNGEDLIFDAGGRIERIGTRMDFVWDASGRLIERTLEGERVEMRFGGRGMSVAGGIPHILSVGNITIELATGAHRYRHDDHRGNVLWVTDEAGNVITHYIYEPYGLYEVLGDDTDPVRFAKGTQLDDDLVLLGARVYDQATGRFLSPDPIYQVINQFAYALGNPIAFSDPSGRELAPSSPESCSGNTKGKTATAVAAAATAAFAAGAATVAWAAAVPLPPGIAAAIAAAFAIEAGFAAYFAVDDVLCACRNRLRKGTVTVEDLPDDFTSDPGQVSMSCAPTRAHRVADPQGLLLFLIELQLLLWPGLLVLRRSAR